MSRHSWLIFILIVATCVCVHAQKQTANAEQPKAPREKTARLLAEGDDRLHAHAARPSSVGARGSRTACSSTLKAMHTAQPTRLYQR